MTICLYGETWSHIFCTLCQLFRAEVSFNIHFVLFENIKQKLFEKIINTNNILIYCFRMIVPVLCSWHRFMWEKITLTKNWTFFIPCRFFLSLFKYNLFLRGGRWQNRKLVSWKGFSSLAQVQIPKLELWRGLSTYYTLE